MTHDAELLLQRFPEPQGAVAARDPAQIKDWDQGVQTLRTARVAWQDCRRKPDLLAVAAAISNLRLLNLDRTNACLDDPLGQMAMSNQTRPTVLRGQIGMSSKKVRHLGFGRLSQELARSLTQHVGQQIFKFLWLAQGNDGILAYGVSLHSGRCGWLISTTIRRLLSDRRQRL